MKNMRTVGNDIAVSGDARVAIIGIGGSGCRIASRFYGKMSRVGVIAINTDRKSLEETPADVRLYICKEVTKGLGTNGDPALGKKCAQIHESEIAGALETYDYAYIIAGMGGGTGTGAASVVAELCDRMHVAVGAIAVMPFSFEGRAVKAAEGYRALHAVCPDVIRCENDKALTAEGVKTLDDAMTAINDAIVDAVSKVVADYRNKVRKDISEHGYRGRNDISVTDAAPAPVLGIQKSI